MYYLNYYYLIEFLTKWKNIILLYYYALNCDMCFQCESKSGIKILYKSGFKGLIVPNKCTVLLAISVAFISIKQGYFILGPVY